MKHHLLAILILAAPAFAQPASQRPPNIILILADDLGHRDLACTGSTYFQTPHLDRLAQRGIRFTQAYAAAPVCSPTRAALLTGIHPARLHLTDWLPGRRDMPSQKLLRPAIITQLPKNATTLPEALKQTGYAAAHVGKWHLGGESSLPTDHGFDLNVGGTHAGSPPGGYFNFKTPTLETNGEYLTDRLTTESINFIERNQSRPFFLYLAHYTVHIPLQAKKELIARYTDESKKNDPQYNPIYAAMIHSMDESVGRIVEKLEQLKLLENTLIIFTSDNGGLSTKEGPNTPATSNAPLRAGKGHLHEGGLRVPLIIHHPAVLQPSVIQTPTITMDLYPTLLRAAGLHNETPDAATILPAPPHDRPLFWHYPHYSNQGGRPSSAIRQGHWKLIEFLEDNRLELYNLNEDPSETTNLAQRHPDEARRLLRLLREWRREIDVQFPTPNPDYRPPA